MVSVNTEGINLVILYDGGIVGGKQRTIRRSYSQVVKTATAEQLLAAGNAISSLCKFDAFKIHEVKTSHLKDS